ncbi:branched-chain amino acid transport system II carrier protein [Candidatus Tisiphia endosymbiont of Nedyus quadrimaculatus]|uniref:branched-chain amino acid transport system II carrier protein n=1 Tax=Candidatus Tisiphia endosymbiont of Nedyus quadrimaculatus TaxID=3139332 RepID=UPI00345EF5DD
MQRHLLIYGFSIFSMFFGSGNLVFPLQIGVEVGNHWFIGFIGLFLTGIILPFLGLFVIKLHKGNYNDFFAEAGTLSRLFLPLFTLSLLGSFGVVPRCITVAYGGIEYIFPGLSLIIFSFLFCTVCFVVCLNDRYMISILGKWLTPLLLLSLTFLIILGVINAPEITTENPTLRLKETFLTGFLQGYETMDLFAAFFFSSLVFKQIQSFMGESVNHKDIIKFALKPSIIGAALLSVVYLGFVYLGSKYGHLLQNTTAELFFPTIISHLLGSKAALIIGVIVILSCLTTAVALNNIYAHYICSSLKVKEKSFPVILLIVTIISFAVSLVDFKGITGFLAPLLEISYPSLIALTFLSIFLKEHRLLKAILFYGIMIVVLLYKFLYS